MLLLLGFAFLSGLVTILAPCIWPLLPIVLSSSVGGKSSARPAGISLGIMLSFTIFTLGISSLVRLFGFDPNILRTIAVIIIVFLGLCLLIPALSQRLEGAMSRLSNRFSGKTTQGTDFRAGFVTGLSLGVLWAPCAGPILATIAALAVTGQVSLSVIALTVAYVLGVGIPLFLLGYGGQRFLKHTKRLNAYTGRIQQVFGLVMILAAVAIYTNYDKVIQLKLTTAFPRLGSVLMNVENNSQVEAGLNRLIGAEQTKPANNLRKSELYNEQYVAPEFTGLTRWLNTDQGLSLKDLKGKVVLIDFWTYTCINCLRTLPHVTQWYDTYKDKGFVVIGIHTPEFEFEKKTENVKQAIKANKINYPVAQDNDFATWYAYQNRYWPAHYLIDAQGNVRRTHFGEGKYEEMEEAIKGLLIEAGASVTGTTQVMPDQTPRRAQSPETYLGSGRANHFHLSRTLKNGTQQFTLSNSPPEDTFSLGGEWIIGPEKATAGRNAKLNYHFKGSKVFLVLRPGTQRNGVIRLSLDGKPLDTTQAGADVKDGQIVIDEDRLYTLVDLKEKSEEHTLLIEFLDPGIEAFAFTFG